VWDVACDACGDNDVSAYARASALCRHVMLLHSNSGCTHSCSRSPGTDQQRAGSRLLDVARVDALQAHGVDRLPQRVVDAAADDALAQATIVERLDERRGRGAREQVVQERQRDLRAATSRQPTIGVTAQVKLVLGYRALPPQVHQTLLYLKLVRVRAPASRCRRRPRRAPS
jgi:hypothetical protein